MMVTLFNSDDSYKVVLTSTLIYELIGPMVAKFALNKAGEIPKENL